MKQKGKPNQTRYNLLKAFDDVTALENSISAVSSNYKHHLTIANEVIGLFCFQAQSRSKIHETMKIFMSENDASSSEMLGTKADLTQLFQQVFDDYTLQYLALRNVEDNDYARRRAGLTNMQDNFSVIGRAIPADMDAQAKELVERAQQKYVSLEKILAPDVACKTLIDEKGERKVLLYPIVGVARLAMHDYMQGAYDVNVTIGGLSLLK